MKTRSRARRAVAPGLALRFASFGDDPIPNPLTDPESGPPAGNTFTLQLCGVKMYVEANGEPQVSNSTIE